MEVDVAAAAVTVVDELVEADAVETVVLVVAPLVPELLTSAAAVVLATVSELLVASVVAASLAHVSTRAVVEPDAPEASDVLASVALKVLAWAVPESPPPHPAVAKARAIAAQTRRTRTGQPSNNIMSNTSVSPKQTVSEPSRSDGLIMVGGSQKICFSPWTGGNAVYGG
ncbi:hypothetical protein [Aquabacterium sp.]|uniref:hypothetical protein n=1 Tax=Aquabacterium sp. TaxID=1872578 RepID=UPI0025C6513D|nr:hypothetical protein [Aquabacterium sp.]